MSTTATIPPADGNSSPQSSEPQRPSPSPSPWKAAFTSRAFLAAVVVLALAAVGLNAATDALQLYFKKLPVPLRARLDDDKAGVPEQLGNWVMVSEQNALDPDVQHSLGTRDFVFRAYLDTAAVPPELMAALKPTLNNPEQAAVRQAILTRIQEVAPQAVLSLNVTYYTGMVDTVTHIPERCMVADGYEPKNPQTVTLQAGTYPDGSPRQIAASFATFEDQTGRGRMNRHVAYFFHCNGGYEPNPVAVRVKLQNLFERHGYYAKVELMADEPARPSNTAAGKDLDAKRAASAEKVNAAMGDLLAQALPSIERCLPDWAAVKASGAK
jgi:hypothetical protein